MPTDDDQKQPIILAVDDAPANIDVVKGILSEEYFVQAAINGQMALKIAKRKQPDLILLDIIMPEMDGFEVCRQIKAHPNTRDVPVIFVTGQNSVMDEAKGLMLGAVDFILKPVEPKLLLSRIRVHLNQRKRWLVRERELLTRITQLEHEVASLKSR
ncbi:MAG: response regulator [Magnetococcales bacterium]|nr:response regulator [Magnetococcales bacterium]